MYLSNKCKSKVYYIYFTNSLTGKYTRISTRTKSKPEAVKFLSDFKNNLKSRIERAEQENSKVHYISDLQTEVIKYVSDNMSASNTKLYKTLFKNILEFFGDVPINLISFKDIELYKGKRLETVSKASVNKDLSILKSAFNIAIRFNWIKQNPAKNVKKVILSEKERLCFEPEQIKLIINNIHNVTFKNLVIFALHTGCRLNEVINIQWRDINLHERLITIRNKADFKTKTGKIRQVPISDNLYSLLKSLMYGDNNEKIVNFINTDMYLFCNANGYKYSKHYASAYFKKVLRKLNIAEKFHFHCLRHTFITQLIKAGVNINYVKEIAGHSTIGTTMNYIHISTNDLRDAVNKVSVF